MKIKTQLLSLIFTFFTIVSFSQSSFNNVNNTPKGQVNLPLENVYVHINSASFFVGERLYYKVYNTTLQNNQLSPYSKVAYVSLVGINNTKVFNQKVILKNGQGYGDFLIPTEIPSGNYKLIAYTKMGLNQAQNNAFVTDVSIINPYTSLNPELINIVETKLENLQAIQKETTSSSIQIILPKPSFGKREQVILQLSGNDENVFGNYSISINKLDNLIVTFRPDITNTTFNQKKLPLASKSNFLPELRGDLIAGKISATNGQASIKNQPIAFSIPNEKFVLKVGATNDEGRFFINLDERYLSSTAYLQVLNNQSEDYKFIIDEHPVIDLSSLTFEKLTLSMDLKDHIIDRSIKNQIENSYFSVKQTLPKAIEKPFFFGNNYTLFNLDDFKRFSTLHETLTEIVQNVWFERKGRDGYEIRVRAIDFDLRSPFPPLVMVDGLLIQDHTILYNFSAFNIQNIRVVRDKYFYGSKIFQGIVNIETIDNDFHKTAQIPALNPIKLSMPEPEKNYFKADYSQEAGLLNNIPDFRKQLLWHPSLTIQSMNTEVDFYTSDESGTFEIVIEGISSQGKAIKASKQFTVK